ncbi:MAG: amidohydrolase family protein [Candidatus Competibacteraceae bacterium]|nr:amidohydrolase family protein [Candidatus Competibacteraceae bacterium]
MKKYVCILLFITPILLLAQRPSPGMSQQKSILIKNAIIHDGNRNAFLGSVGFNNGIITYLQNPAMPDYQTPVFDTIIDANGQHLYPGFILLNTTLGLTEVDAVRATRDFSETGEMRSEVRSVIAYNTDSKIIPTVRNNGVLLAQPTPQGGIISGQSGIVQLDAWNWEDAVILIEDGIHLHWPSRIRTYTPWDDEQASYRFQNNRTKNIYQIEKLFLEGYQYHLSKDSKPVNHKLAAMDGLFTGKKNLYLHADSENEIMESVLFFESLHVKNIVLVGASSAYSILSFIKSHNLSVILSRIHALPSHEDHPIHQPYRLPALLDSAGILFSIDYSGDMEAMGSRNLPFTAGTAVAYGLDYEAAVSVLTLQAARIIGIDDKYGSIQPGKSATFFLTAGDALDMSSNLLTKAYIDGRLINLGSHQYDLYKQYLHKYGLKER